MGNFADIWEEFEATSPTKQDTEVPAHFQCAGLDAAILITPTVREALEEVVNANTVEFTGVIVMPDHVLDGCRAKLVELCSTPEGHEVVVELLEDRRIFHARDVVTIQPENWKEDP